MAQKSARQEDIRQYNLFISYLFLQPEYCRQNGGPIKKKKNQAAPLFIELNRHSENPDIISHHDEPLEAFKTFERPTRKLRMN